MLLLTAVGAVPQHRRLTGGWADVAFRALLRVDTLRALARPPEPRRRGGCSWH